MLAELRSARYSQQSGEGDREGGPVNTAMYEVWSSCGDGCQRGPRFRLLDDAVRYVTQHNGEASFAIRCPDGHWYEFRGGSHHRERLHAS